MPTSQARDVQPSISASHHSCPTLDCLTQDYITLWRLRSMRRRHSRPSTLLIMLYRQWRDAMKVNRLPCSRSPNKLGSGMPCLSTDFHSASAGSRSNHGPGTSDEEAFCRDDNIVLNRPRGDDACTSLPGTLCVPGIFRGFPASKRQALGTLRPLRVGCAPAMNRGRLS